MRAKFTVESIKHVRWGREVEMQAVGDNSPENNQFSKATPSGKITMLVSNPEVYDFLQVGSAYYLDFTQDPE